MASGGKRGGKGGGGIMDQELPKKVYKMYKKEVQGRRSLRRVL